MPRTRICCVESANYPRSRRAGETIFESDSGSRMHEWRTRGQTDGPRTTDANLADDLGPLSVLCCPWSVRLSSVVRPSVVRGLSVLDSSPQLCSVSVVVARLGAYGGGEAAAAASGTNGRSLAR